LVIMTDETRPMQERVKKWVEGEGYPLEMKAAAAFRGAGFEVRQAQYYIDSDSGKSREIDVVAQVSDHYGLASMRVVVECKTTEKPWVVFSSPHTLRNYNKLFALGILSEAVLKALTDLSAGGIAKLSEQLRWFAKSGSAGYAAAQAFTGNQELPFSAAMGAVKACLAQGPGSYNPPFRADFPVIVLDAPLLDCHMNDRGDLQLQEVTEHEFLFAPHLPAFKGTCVRVVTLAGLADFCGAARNEMEALLRIVAPAVESEWQAFKERTRPSG
jgi:hypothetical protein